MTDEQRAMLMDRSTVSLPKAVIHAAKELALRDDTPIYMILMSGLSLYKKAHPERNTISTGIKRGRPNRKPRDTDFLSGIADQMES